MHDLSCSSVSCISVDVMIIQRLPYASVTLALVTGGCLIIAGFHRSSSVCQILLPVFLTSVEWSHNPPVTGGASEDV